MNITKLATYLTVSMILPTVLLAVVSLSGYLSLSSVENKGGAFECGFLMFSMTGMPFSMPFFVISLMFLLFDVEILLICFYPLVQNFTFFLTSYYWLILVAIGMTTMFEWQSGVLSWI